MSLEIKRKKLELSRVLQAKDEMEFKIEELKESITRIEKDILIQAARADQIKIEIEKMSGGE